VDLQSLQLRYAPEGRCFGCGPKNADGLRIRSYDAGDGTVVTTWQPRPEHEAFDGYVNGGILGTLIDCHSNWTAIHALMTKSGASEAPSTVTAEYSVQFLKPTPSNQPLRLIGRVANVSPGGEVKVRFLPPGEAVSALLEKLAFRRHRRAVAGNRQPPSRPRGR